VNVQADSLDGPQALITTNDLCEGDQLYIIAVLGSNVNATWTGPNGFSQTGSSDVIISSIQTQQSGYYVVTLDNGVCYSSPDSVLINVFDSVPNYSIQSSPPCEGYTVLINTQPAITFNSTWTLPNGGTSGNSLLTLSPYDSSMAGTYSLQVSNGVCPAYFDSIYLPPPGNGSVLLTATDTIGCIGDTLVASATSTAGSLVWQPGSITGNTYSVTYSGQVSCILTDSTGCTFDSNTLEFVFNSPPSLTVSSNSPVCEGDTVQLVATIFAGGVSTYQFQWNGPNGVQSSQTNLSIPAIDTLASGLYFGIVSDSVCGSRSDSVSVTIIAAPLAPVILSNGPVCIGDTLILEATGNNTLQWIDPAGNILVQPILVIPAFGLQDTGIYTVQALNGICPPASGIIRIVPDTCSTEAIDFDVPNVFTPNNDGINDLFLPNLPDGTQGSMTIYNRWGKTIYEGDLLKGWNGKNNQGVDQAESTYYYIIRPVGSNVGMWESKTGFVELLR
jgi:gliding motility-associated-like protein